MLIEKKFYLEQHWSNILDMEKALYLLQHIQNLGHWLEGIVTHSFAIHACAYVQKENLQDIYNLKLMNLFYKNFHLLNYRLTEFTASKKGQNDNTHSKLAYFNWNQMKAS